MIKIARCNCPSVLANNPQSATSYRNKSVVQALWRMQKEKCCYCECKIPESGHLKAVEHFRPKSVFKYLKNEWNNLLLACSLCNGHKSNKYPIILSDAKGETKVLYIKAPQSGVSAIIDPSDPNINPEVHLDFVTDDGDDAFCTIIPKNDNPLGKETIDVCQLRSSYYTKEWRRYCILVLKVTFENMMIAKDNADQDQLQVQIDRYNIFVSSNSIFAALARSFARSKNLDQRFGVYIP